MGGGGWYWSPESVTLCLLLLIWLRASERLCMVFCAVFRGTAGIDCFLSSAPTAPGPWLWPGEPAFSVSCFQTLVKQHLPAELAQINESKQSSSSPKSEPTKVTGQFRSFLRFLRLQTCLLDPDLFRCLWFTIFIPSFMHRRSCLPIISGHSPYFSDRLGLFPRQQLLIHTVVARTHHSSRPLVPLPPLTPPMSSSVPTRCVSPRTWLCPQPDSLSCSWTRPLSSRRLWSCRTS